MKLNRLSSLTTGILYGAALPLAAYFCISLTILGVNKYHYILSGGKKFATFPNFESYLSVSVAYFGLMLLHLFWVLGSDRVYQFPNFPTLLRYAGIFLLLAFVAYPLGNDVYLYLHVGLMDLNHVDPFLIPAGAFLSRFTPFVDWKQTSTYGPISQLLFALSSVAVSVHPIAAVYVFKLICLVTHIFNGFLVWQISPIAIRGKLAIGYLLCPLLLLEQVCSAHVDVFVCTSILLTALCLYRQRLAMAFLTLWAGFLTKTIPIIWMPLLALFLLQQRRWKQLRLGLLASGAIVTVLSLTMLTSLDAWRSLLNPGVTGQYQASIHALVRAGFETLPFFVLNAPPPSQYKSTLLHLSRYTLIGFAGFYVWTALRIFRRSYSAAKLLEGMGWVTLVLMLYATSWLMPWYVSILYAIAVTIPRARLFGLTTLMFGVSSSAMYLLYDDAGLRSLTAIGLPTLTLVWGALFLRESNENGIRNGK